MRQHHCIMSSKSPEIWRCFCITESYKLIESYWGRGTVQYSAPIFAKKLFQTHSEVSRLFFLQYVSPHNDSISDPQTSTETETLAGGQWALVPQSDIKTPREVDREWQNSILWKKNHKLIKSVSIVSPRQQWDKMETPVSQHISVMCSIFIWMQTFLIKFSQKPMIWAASHIKTVYNSKLFLYVKYCCISDSNFWIRICIQSHCKMQNMHNGDCKYSNKRIT